MSATDVGTDISRAVPTTATCDMKLEVVTLPVSDVDRAKRFYQGLGWRLDSDIVVGDAFRAVQLTPPHVLDRVREGPHNGSPWLRHASVARRRRHRRTRTSADAASRSARSSISTGAVFQARTRKVAPTRAMHRSAIRKATSGWCRRSRRGFRAGSGRTDDGHPFCGASAA
jgi:catechol 2,3-dioxygenase-like lactoylglutathione lyase family enzyme